MEMEASDKVSHRFTPRPVHKYKTKHSEITECGVPPCITYIQLGKHEMLIYESFMQGLPQAPAPAFHEASG
jgi:hypothetical protein